MSNLEEKNPPISSTDSKSESDVNPMAAIENEMEFQKDENQSTNTSMCVDASENKQIDEINSSSCVENADDEKIIVSTNKEEHNDAKESVLDNCKNDFIKETKSIIGETALEKVILAEDHNTACKTTGVILIDDEIASDKDNSNENNEISEESLMPKVSDETKNIVEKVVETDHNNVESDLIDNRCNQSKPIQLVETSAHEDSRVDNINEINSLVAVENPDIEIVPMEIEDPNIINNISDAQEVENAVSNCTEIIDSDGAKTEESKPEKINSIVNVANVQMETAEQKVINYVDDAQILDKSGSSASRDNKREHSPSPHDIWKQYDKEVALEKKRIEREYSNYRQQPENHPLYVREGNRFWKQRKDELFAEGIDHRTYNYQAEWVHYFKNRLEELYCEAVREIKNTVRMRLNITADGKKDKHHMAADEVVPAKMPLMMTSPFGIEKPQAQEQIMGPAVAPMPVPVPVPAPSAVSVASNSSTVGSKPQYEAPVRDDKPNVIHALRLLTAMEDHLGSLGSKIMDLFSKALQLEKKCNNNSALLEKCVLTSDNCNLLEVAMEKLKGVLFAGLLEGNKAQSFNRIIKTTEDLLTYAESRGWRDSCIENSPENSNNASIELQKLINAFQNKSVAPLIIQQDETHKPINEEVNPLGNFENVQVETDKHKNSNNEHPTIIKNTSNAQEVGNTVTHSAEVNDSVSAQTQKSRTESLNSIANVVETETDEVKNPHNVDDVELKNKAASSCTEVIDLDEDETQNPKSQEVNSLVAVETLEIEIGKPINSNSTDPTYINNNVNNAQNIENPDSSCTEVIDKQKNSNNEDSNDVIKAQENDMSASLCATKTQKSITKKVNAMENDEQESTNIENVASRCTEIIDVDAAETKEPITEAANVQPTEHKNTESSETINSAQQQSQTEEVSKSLNISSEKEQNDDIEVQNNLTENIEIIDDDDVIVLSDNEDADGDVQQQNKNNVMDLNINEVASVANNNMPATSCALDCNEEVITEAENCVNNSQLHFDGNSDEEVMLVDQDNTNFIEISDDEFDNIDMASQHEEDISTNDQLTLDYDANKSMLSNEVWNTTNTKSQNSSPQKVGQRDTSNQAADFTANKINRSPAFTAMEFGPTLEGNTVTGLLGVSYVLEIMQQPGDKNPKYDCCLCEVTYKAVLMQEHLESLQHRLAYCTKHFPTVLRQFRQCIGNVDTNSSKVLLGFLVKKLAIAIELHHGRDLPTKVLRSVYQDECHDIRNKVFSRRFPSEENGPTFANVVDLSQMESIKKQAETSNRSSTITAESVTFNRSPVVNAQKIFKPKFNKFIPNRFQRKNNPYNRRQKRFNNRMFQQSGPNLQDPLANFMHNMLNPNFDMMQMQIAPRRQLDAPLLPFKSILKPNANDSYIPDNRGFLHTPFNNNQPRVQEQVPIISQSERPLPDKLQEIHNLYTRYKNDPNSYPNYKKEWEAFWKKRKCELMEQGLDHYNYDYKSEWMNYFSDRLVNKHAEAVANILNERTDGISCSPRIPNISNNRVLVQETNENQTFGKCSKLLSLLRLLCALEEHLGCSTSDVMQLLNETLKAERNNSSGGSCNLLNLENCAVLRLIAEKFKGIVLAEIVNEQKRCVLRKAIRDIEELLSDIC